MILGIDPGVRKMGYAIITSQLQIIDAGVIIIDTPGKIHREDYRSRMTHMRQFFVDLLLQFPDIHAASVEKLFAFRNHNNIEYVYGIRGMLMSLLQEHGCQLYEYTPLQLKKYIAGHARSSKEQMIERITQLFQLSEDVPYHDTADALGLAYLASKAIT